LWKTEAGRCRTKIQPFRDINPELRKEAERLGNLNAFLTGVLGSGLFVLHLRVYPWAMAHMDEISFLRFLRDAVISYVWIDLSAYWLHRLLHTKSLYFLHKSHHRYTIPTAHAVFASHPLDFIVFQVLGMAVLGLFPLHALAFIFAAGPTEEVA
jgi:Delta7-sterol 5-desaturase